LCLLAVSFTNYQTWVQDSNCQVQNQDPDSTAQNKMIRTETNVYRLVTWGSKVFIGVLVL